MCALPVYVDRDGVINENCDDYVRSLSQWIPVKGAFSSLAALSRAGHPIVVVTNQSAVARGYTTLANIEEIHVELLRLSAAAGGVIQGIYYCPHHPDDGCGCRKPETGMIDAARKEHDLPQGGWIIGDAATDMELGRRAGIETILVLTGRGAEQLQMIREKGSRMPDVIVENLGKATAYILASHSTT